MEVVVFVDCTNESLQTNTQVDPEFALVKNLSSVGNKTF